MLGLGVEPSRVIFAHPAKPATHIRYAAALGVNLATFDNEDELYKLRALHPKCKWVQREGRATQHQQVLVHRRDGRKSHKVAKVRKVI